jgi:hypothetical protein
MNKNSNENIYFDHALQAALNCLNEDEDYNESDSIQNNKE